MKNHEAVYHLQVMADEKRREMKSFGEHDHTIQVDRTTREKRNATEEEESMSRGLVKRRMASLQVEIEALDHGAANLCKR